MAENPTIAQAREKLTQEERAAIDAAVNTKTKQARRAGKWAGRFQVLIGGGLIFVVYYGLSQSFDSPADFIKAIKDWNFDFFPEDAEAAADSDAEDAVDDKEDAADAEVEDAAEDVEDAADIEDAAADADDTEKTADDERGADAVATQTEEIIKDLNIPEALADRVKIIDGEAFIMDASGENPLARVYEVDKLSDAQYFRTYSDQKYIIGAIDGDMSLKDKFAVLNQLINDGFLEKGDIYKPTADASFYNPNSESDDGISCRENNQILILDDNNSGCDTKTVITSNELPQDDPVQKQDFCESGCSQTRAQGIVDTASGQKAADFAICEDHDGIVSDNIEKLVIESERAVPITVIDKAGNEVPFLISEGPITPADIRAAMENGHVVDGPLPGTKVIYIQPIDPATGCFKDPYCFTWHDANGNGMLDRGERIIDKHGYVTIDADLDGRTDTVVDSTRKGQVTNVPPHGRTLNTWNIEQWTGALREGQVRLAKY